MKRMAPAGPSRSVSARHPSIRIWYSDIDETCGSCCLSFNGQRNFVWAQHAHSQLPLVNARAAQQSIIRSREPFRLCLFSECQMQRIEWTKAKSGELAGTVDGRGFADS